MTLKLRRILIFTLFFILALALSLISAGCNKNVDTREKLPTPMNVRLEIDMRTSGNTYVLRWDAVENAKTYSVSIDDKTVTATTNEYVLYNQENTTQLVKLGVYASAKVTAIGNRVYADSEPAKEIIRVERITQGLRYEENDDGKTATVYRAFDDVNTGLEGRVVMPDYYNGKRITVIGKDAFSDTRYYLDPNYPNPNTGLGCNTTTTSYRIPTYLEKIGDNAFAYCTVLRKIDFPSTLTEIGSKAFTYCIRLNNLDITSVNTIKTGAFKNCNMLEEIAFPTEFHFLGSESFNETAWYKNYEDEDMCIINGNVLYSYKSASKLTELTLPEYITAIAEGVFYNCWSLKSVYLHDNIQFLGGKTFMHCTILTDVKLPANLKKLWEHTFERCDQLESIELPETLTEIGDNAFYFCQSLQSITIPESVTTIGESAFACSGIKNIKIPDSIQIIEKYTFAACSDLTYIILPKSLKSISELCVSSSSHLKDIFYEGTYEEYRAITHTDVYDPNDISKNKMSLYTAFYTATKTYYSEEQPTEGTMGPNWHYDENMNPVLWVNEALK